MSSRCSQITLSWSSVSLCAGITVHAHTRVWLERLLSGAGRIAWAALHPVSLSPPQPAMAGPVHGERYRTQYSYVDISVLGSLNAGCVNVHMCLCWALACSSVRAGYQLRASIYSYGPADSQPSPFTLDASIRSAEALSGKQALSFHFLSPRTMESEGEETICLGDFLNWALDDLYV